MGNTYCDGLSSHFALKTTKKIKLLAKLSGTLSGSLWGLESGGPTGYSKFCQLGTVEKGTFVFDFKHFWDALQTFYTFWGRWGDFGGMLGTSQCGHDCE